MRNAFLFQDLDLILTGPGLTIHHPLEEALNTKMKYPTTYFFEITITDFPKSKVTIHILFYFSHLKSNFK